MNNANTVMLAVFVALGVTLVAGLIAIPTIEQAHASILSDRLQLFFDTRNGILCSIGLGSDCN